MYRSLSVDQGGKKKSQAQLQVITEEKFTEVLQEKLGEFWEHALAIFQHYGQPLSWDIFNVLLHAVDQEKVEEVLAILEKHWEDHLRFQHPNIPKSTNALESRFSYLKNNINIHRGLSKEHRKGFIMWYNYFKNQG